MRNRPFFLVCAAVAAIAAAGCDVSTSPRIGSFGSNSVGSTGGSPLVISPSQTQIRVGTTIQLSANVGGQLQWSSSASSTAAVSSTGLVTALSAGSATITARVASDTTNTSSAAITVTP